MLTDDWNKEDIHKISDFFSSYTTGSPFLSLSTSVDTVPLWPVVGNRTRLVLACPRILTMKLRTHLAVSQLFIWCGNFFAMIVAVIVLNTLDFSSVALACLVIGYGIGYLVMKYLLEHLLKAECPDCGMACRADGRQQIVYRCGNCAFTWNSGVRKNSGGGSGLGN